MMQGASAGLGIGQQNANNPGVDYGGLSSALSHMDPLGNKITSIGGDPLNLYGNKNNPNALLFPSGSTGQMGGAFPNLGPASMIPQMPGGAFQALHNGTGAYNNMASIGAGGKTFNPSLSGIQGGGKPTQGAVTPHSKTLGGNALRIKP